jgi:hypothetical protein
MILLGSVIGWTLQARRGFEFGDTFVKPSSLRMRSSGVSRRLPTVRVRSIPNSAARARLLIQQAGVENKLQFRRSSWPQYNTAESRRIPEAIRVFNPRHPRLRFSADESSH